MKTCILRWCSTPFPVVVSSARWWWDMDCQTSRWVVWPSEGLGALKTAADKQQQWNYSIYHPTEIKLYLLCNCVTWVILQGTCMQYLFYKHLQNYSVGLMCGNLSVSVKQRSTLDNVQQYYCRLSKCGYLSHSLLASSSKCHTMLRWGAHKSHLPFQFVVWHAVNYMSSRCDFSMSWKNTEICALLLVSSCSTSFTFNQQCLFN